jgi:hypothetical protein
LYIGTGNAFEHSTRNEPAQKFKEEGTRVKENFKGGEVKIILKILLQICKKITGVPKIFLKNVILGAKKVKNFFKNAIWGKVAFNKNDVGGRPGSTLSPKNLCVHLNKAFQLQQSISILFAKQIAAAVSI